MGRRFELRYKGTNTLPCKLAQATFASKPKVHGRCTREARQGRKTCVLGWDLAAKTWQQHSRLAAWHGSCQQMLRAVDRICRQMPRDVDWSYRQALSTDVEGYREKMPIGAAHSMSAGCAKDVNSTGHKAAACRAVMRSAAMAGSSSNARIDCKTHVGKSWPEVAVWLKTCWSGSKTWQNCFCAVHGQLDVARVAVCLKLGLWMILEQ
ncbi:hypothetical protein GBA52_010578 [Prunus armeniaca]|nr:hypothetical protein GBA52_010578 [Prunus armeniaca]